ncbi:MAG: hypothetical protein ACE5ID_09500, partial [Acidobacteriota bacterium]
FSLTVYFVALINLGLSAMAFSLSRRWGERAMPAPAAPEQNPSSESAGRLRLALSAYAASGAIAFMLQVSWTRILILVFASSVYAFSIILVIFLAGLGGGALLGASLLDRIRSPRQALAWCFVVAGGTGLLGQALYEWLPKAYLEALMKAGQGLPLGHAAALAGLLMLPATLALGTGFPLVLRLASGDERSRVAARVGLLYGVNAAGSVAGAYATALFLIPALGLAGVVSLAASGALAMGILLALAAGQGERRRFWSPVAAAILLVAAWLIFVPGWNRDLMSQGVAFWASVEPGASENAEKDFQALRAGKLARLLFYRDGVTATVAVKEEKAWEGQINRILTINGKIDASSFGDRPQQILLAHLPLLARNPNEAQVMVIGYASGMTVASALTHPIKQLVAVEIEEEVIHAARFFTEDRPDPLEDARLELVVDDARAYLERARKKFDVIISSPSSPWLSGSAKLDTLEMYALIRRHLKAGGLYCQYTQSYGLDRESAESLLRTLARAFPYLAVFDAGGDVLLVVASGEPVRYDPDRLARVWQRQKVHDDLVLAGIRSPLGLLESFLGDDVSVSAILPPGMLNTDDNAFIEYRGPKTVALNVHAQLVNSIRDHSPGPVSLIAGLPPSGSVDPGRLALLALRQSAVRTAVSLAKWTLDRTPDPVALWTLGESLRQQDRRPLALEKFNRALNLDPRQGLSLVSRAISLQELGREKEALEALANAARVLGQDPLILYYRGLAQMELGQPAKALASFQAASHEAGPQGLPVPVEVPLARVLEQLKRPTEARLNLEAYLLRLEGHAAPSVEAAAAYERLATPWLRPIRILHG